MMSFFCCITGSKTKPKQQIDKKGEKYIQQSPNNENKDKSILKQINAQKISSPKTVDTIPQDTTDQFLLSSSRKRNLQNGNNNNTGSTNISNPISNPISIANSQINISQELSQESQAKMKTLSFFQTDDLLFKNKHYLLTSFLIKGYILPLIQIQKIQTIYIKVWNRDRPYDKQFIQEYQTKFSNKFDRQACNSEKYSEAMRKKDESFLYFLRKDHLVSEDLFLTLNKLNQPIQTLIQLVGPASFAYKSIRRLYQTTKKLKRFYIILELQKEEKLSLIKRIKQNKLKFFAFNSFVKGYSDYETAYTSFLKRIGKRKITQTNVFFIEVIHKYEEYTQTQFDYGYYTIQQQKDSENLIINIKNVFLFEEFKQDRQILQVKYGVLPLIDKIKNDHVQRGRLTTVEKNMRRNIDFIQHEAQKISSLSSIFLEFQKYTFAEKSAQALITNAIQDKSSQQTIGQLRIKIGNIFLAAKTNDFEQKYKENLDKIDQKSKLKTVGKVHLVKFYYDQLCQGEDIYRQKFISELSRITSQEIEYIFHDDRLKDEGIQAYAYKAIVQIQKEGATLKDIKNGIQSLKKLKNDLFYKYKLKVQGIPLNHFLIMQIAKADIKRKWFLEAQKHLEHLTEWMKSCQLSNNIIAVLDIRKTALEILNQQRKLDQVTSEREKLVSLMQAEEV